MSNENAWMPIDTAPKDGETRPARKIIIGNQYWTRTVFFIPAGTISEPEEGDLWSDIEMDWVCPVDKCTATHWRPNDVPSVPMKGSHHAS